MDAFDLWALSCSPQVAETRQSKTKTLRKDTPALEWWWVDDTARDLTTDIDGSFQMF